MLSPRITETTFLTLVGRAYSAVYDPTCRPDFLRAMAFAIEGSGTVIFQHNFDTLAANTASDADPLNVAVHFDQQQQKDAHGRAASALYASHASVRSCQKPRLMNGLVPTTFPNGET